MTTDSPRREFIHKRACEFLLSCDITSLPVNPFEMIRKQHWGLVSYKDLTSLSQHGRKIDLTELSGTADGFTVFCKNNYCIAYNSETKSAARINFTLMHEAGHIILEHFDGKIVYEKRAYDLFEKEANLFASEVLAPPCAIIASLIDTPEKLSSACCISHGAAVLALENLKTFRPTETDKQLAAKFSVFIEINRRRKNAANVIATL